MQGRWKQVIRSDFFRNVATLISGTTLAQAFSILIYLILSRIYTEEDFGIFGIYMNVLSITIIFSTAKYELSILLPKSERDAVNLVGLSGVISVSVSLLLLVIMIFFRDLFARWLGNGEVSRWLLFIPLSTLLVGSFNSLRNYSNRQKRYRLIAGANISQSLGNSLTKLGLGLLIAGSAGLIFGVIFGQIIGFIYFFFFHFRSNREKINWISIGEMKQLGKQYNLFPRYNMLQGLINNISGALPVFIISSFFSTAAAGLFTFGYMIVHRPVNLIANAFYQVMFQRFVEKQHRNSSILPEVMLFIKRNIQILLIPFILIGVFAPELFGFLFGDKWIEAGRYTRIILPWIFMVSLVMPLSFIPDLYKKQRTAMIIDSIRLAGRLAGLMAGVILKNIYIGLGLFSLVSTIMILYSLLWYIRLVKKNLPVKESGPILKVPDE
ncbi:MAG: oligosaccharide flippase family protein [Bacteroidales bacterium]|nr:oligosaccharide flippase family protein [Bacteroidales bacterium]MBN2699120.1 oligosaccharide flippase family protein [Bacteroidales bacterium]